MANDTPEDWAALFAAIGGRAELARVCDVSESTVWRWSRRVMRPGSILRATVNNLCDSHGVARVFSEEGTKHA